MPIEETMPLYPVLNHFYGKIGSKLEFFYVIDHIRIMFQIECMGHRVPKQTLELKIGCLCIIL